VTAAQAFPGATGVTLLDVYDWPTADGLRGGSAHIHLASTEGYVVLRGAGRLQTLGSHGYQETPLRPGDCLWFTPGTVHRLVNDDGQLQILVVMQNAGLPEAGDCVLTFPPDVLADPARYQAAATLSTGPETSGLEAAARRRRDLAIEGFLALRDQVLADGPAALQPFLDAAVALTAARVPDWRRRWRGQAAAVSELTGQQLDGIEARDAAHLHAAGLVRVPHPAGPRGYGMCGRLTPYPAGPPPQD
jgi:mannose-6-phosphate isomerase-like protein (cupin superfamily)